MIVAALFQGEEVLSLASIYSFGILIAFGLAKASIVWLRITEPDMPRPFMMHGNVWIRGRLIPVTAVAGAVTAFAAWVIALGTHPVPATSGVLWMIGGLRRLHDGARPGGSSRCWSATSRRAPPPEEAVDLPSGPIVVPLERTARSAEEVMATACRLAPRAGAPVVAVSAILVPVQDPLDTPRPERDQAGGRGAGDGRARWRRSYGIEFRGVVVRTRNPGRTIVDAVIDARAPR